MHAPYAAISEDERREILGELLEGWSEDWEDGLGKQANGSMVWSVNAADVMLLVNEIYRLRLAAGLETDKGARPT